MAVPILESDEKGCRDFDDSHRYWGATDMSMNECQDARGLLAQEHKSSSYPLWAAFVLALPRREGPLAPPESIRLLVPTSARGVGPLFPRHHWQVRRAEDMMLSVTGHTLSFRSSECVQSYITVYQSDDEGSPANAELLCRVSSVQWPIPKSIRHVYSVPSCKAATTSSEILKDRALAECPVSCTRFLHVLNWARRLPGP